MKAKPADSAMVDIVYANGHTIKEVTYRQARGIIYELYPDAEFRSQSRYSVTAYRPNRGANAIAELMIK